MRRQSARCLWLLFTTGLFLTATSCASPKQTETMHDHTNALIDEASPYLLQHAHNPVDWIPWSEAAFQKAKSKDKVVFLSVGYAACHWCHVMAHESFENDSIARYLNEHFVCIKVDREERPDIDHHYMQAVQRISGSGGWPMSVFLTPDKKPFFGGTYWPPENRYGRPGFVEILKSVQSHWVNNRAELLGSADQVHAILEQTSRLEEHSGDLVPALFDSLIAKSAVQYDKVYGGFGQAPKFPHAMELSMLLREFARIGNDDARSMVEHTLDKMSRGGIYDHLGGGFARYSTDARWLVPHFEKMLYDNALLIPLLLDASLAFDREDFRRTAIECLDWALREMETPEGGFASSLDADSEGEEGKFYVWTPDELVEALGEERGSRFAKIYDVTLQGNFEQGNSILNLPVDIVEWAERLDVDAKVFGGELNQDRTELLEARDKRIRPGRDDKVLTDWNGLFLSALVRGYAVTGDQRYLHSAERCANRLLLPFEKNGRLVHSFLGDRRQESQLLLDYAAFGNGLLDLFFATGEIRWFEGAYGIADTLHELFQNPEGLYFLSTDAISGVKSVDPFDSAMPSGNSLAGNLMAKLFYVTGEDHFRQRAESQVKPIAGYIKDHASAFAQAELTADMLVFPPSQLVLVGDEDRKFSQAVNEQYLPRTLTIWIAEKLAEKIADESILSALLSGKSRIENKATAYLCRDFACEFPAMSVAELKERLK